jgi:hypothetical protein
MYCLRAAKNLSDINSEVYKLEIIGSAEAGKMKLE